MTIGEYLRQQGRKLPWADSHGRISSEAYAKAGLPMVVACKTCDMSFVLTENRLCDAHGWVYCSEECAS